MAYLMSPRPRLIELCKGAEIFFEFFFLGFIDFCTPKAEIWGAAVRTRGDDVPHSSFWETYQESLLGIRPFSCFGRGCGVYVYLKYAVSFYKRIAVNEFTMSP